MIIIINVYIRVSKTGLTTEPFWPEVPMKPLTLSGSMRDILLCIIFSSTNSHCLIVRHYLKVRTAIMIVFIEKRTMLVICNQTGFYVLSFSGVFVIDTKRYANSCCRLPILRRSITTQNWSCFLIMGISITSICMGKRLFDVNVGKGCFSQYFLCQTIKETLKNGAYPHPD